MRTLIWDDIKAITDFSYFHDFYSAYIAKTVLTLDMAYNDARLIAKPDNDWLIP